VESHSAQPNLAQSLVASHLNPGLPGDADQLAFGVNGAHQIQWEVNVDVLFGRMLAGKVFRHVVAL
jgi:hypothetical protein